ncbi:DNA-binding anti-repressor SinI [Sutcliffiella cohnii]|nr:DNA-binding anti-repressor SinI [Sutcliffiella cohnii]MED4016571.1 DNA-binding anti-repressor SinI [Sutcliffiella cohnii]
MDLEYEIDCDWIQMILEAKEIGVTMEQISEAFKELSKNVE